MHKILNKYGNVDLHFNSYYKYKFSFTGKAKDGAEIWISFGGSPEDIYKLSISKNSTEKLKDHVENGIIMCDVIIKLNNETIFKYWE